MGYEAIVCKIKVRPHNNADRLQVGTAAGTQVVVGLDVQDNSLGILFPTDGQLSLQFCQANDLISFKDPTTGEKKGGLFDEKRKIRSQKLRGENSDGFFCSLDFLLKAGVAEKVIENLKEGDRFCELGGVELCCKYETPATRKKAANIKLAKSKKKNHRFPQHLDTENLLKEIGRIPNNVNYITYISIKKHGTSFRAGFVQEEVEDIKWYHKLLKKFKINLQLKTKLEYVRTIGTRRVILGDVDNAKEDTFYKDAFRVREARKFLNLLKKGEVVYGEILGYSGPETLIMPACDNKLVKDKEFSKQYGPKTEFTYGCLPGSCKSLVYRICRTDENGEVFDLPWPAVEERAKELGLETVGCEVGPFIFRGSEEDKTKLLKMAEIVGQGKDPMGNHIREGAIVRWEIGSKIKLFKHKQFLFKVLESLVKDNDEYEDEEEIYS